MGAETWFDMSSTPRACRSSHEDEKGEETEGEKKSPKGNSSSLESTMRWNVQRSESKSTVSSSGLS